MERKKRSFQGLWNERATGRNDNDSVRLEGGGGKLRERVSNRISEEPLLVSHQVLSQLAILK